ncbi:YecA family protein [Prolixibacter sp. NT017]|uniref:YecA family protein n=1 Tax=Prolixibacter sp. NT017 TaxID=2652390 RepID=UPI001279C031|nr:SEC-C metal-binding domain-containing protein [Prolixibacter sp. NT017]GET24821.1 prepilin peptidase [Prolixibacter sp. NT017]
MDFRKTEDVINEIKSLIYSKGYIYTLCMIIYEDFHIILQEIHKVDFRSRLNKNEVSLLIGFLIQKQIDFTLPDSPLDVIKLKEKTYELMNELHMSLMTPFFEKMQNAPQEKSENINLRAAMKSFYGDDNMFIEPIFYANDGVYDFQYTDFLERKYRYDKQWLIENRSFDFNKTKVILQRIKDVLQKKSKKVNFFSLKENLPEIIEKIKEDNPSENIEEHLKQVLPAYEFYQYVNLFFDSSEHDSSVDFSSLPDDAWKTFYENLIELFVIRREDFDHEVNINSFLNNFSIKINKEKTNTQFKQIGDFNLFNAQPILQIDSERFFVPITFSVFEACYESPYYWMLQDKTYKDILAENRGKSGEEISFEFLSNVFGKERTYKSVKIITKKGNDDTDIDVLCILGSKALCVQVKSKKLTEFSKKGSFAHLQKDFKGAVQDAYEQGIVSRSKILARESKFYDENGSVIELSESIDEVYIMGVTSENYPSLTHQAHTLLEKKDDEPFPLFLTVFDLELVTHYLSNPYDLLYYVRQRIDLMDYFRAESEMIYLGYHLENKLWKLPNNDFVSLDADFGGAIDRNYYPLRLGVDITDEGDSIKNRWKNKDFEILCNLLAKANEPKVTDIIFALLDWDGPSRDNLTKYIRQIKSKTIQDNRWHNFSMLSNNKNGANSGVTYVSWENDNPDELFDRLLTLSKARKYKSKGDIWIGFGSLRNSPQIIDTFIFNNYKWQFDKDLEEATNILFKEKGQGTVFNLDKKIGRNDKCYCGSGLKYKKCCGKLKQ